jgi:hypothetical protein
MQAPQDIPNCTGVGIHIQHLVAMHTNDNIVSSGPRVAKESKGLPAPPLDPIANNRVSGPPWNGHAQPALPQAVWHCMNEQGAAPASTTIHVDRKKLAPFDQTA